MVNLNNESYHSPIGFITPEYLGFLKLQVVPGLRARTKGYLYITRKSEAGYLNLSIVKLASFLYGVDFCMCVKDTVLFVNSCIVSGTNENSKPSKTGVPVKESSGLV
jgi:hypothetical protein